MLCIEEKEKLARLAISSKVTCSLFVYHAPIGALWNGSLCTENFFSDVSKIAVNFLNKTYDNHVLYKWEIANVFFSWKFAYKRKTRRKFWKIGAKSWLPPLIGLSRDIPGHNKQIGCLSMKLNHLPRHALRVTRISRLPVLGSSATVVLKLC